MFEILTQASDEDIRSLAAYLDTSNHFFFDFDLLPEPWLDELSIPEDLAGVAGCLNSFICNFAVEGSLTLHEFWWQDIEPFEFVKKLEKRTENNEVEKAFIQKVRQVFYEKNMFTIWADWLEEFLDQSLTYREDLVPVEVLVRDITIRIERDCEDIVSNLRHALRFTNVHRMVVEVWCEGSPDGSDLETQTMIKQLSGVVQELIDRFGDRFNIVKMRQEDGDWPLPAAVNVGDPYDIRPYWNKPSEAAWKKVQYGLASFEELMQTQVELWIAKAKLANGGTGVHPSE